MLRSLVLAAELTVFLLVTTAASGVLSYASALRFSETDAPPADFPVVVYEGERASPQPGSYSVMRWSEWQAARDKRPAATLLLPERARSLELPDRTRAAFNVRDGGEAQQTVELTRRTADGEQQAIYLAQAREAKPRYLRSSGANILILGAIIGFMAGLYAGRRLRKRYLAPAGLRPPSQN